MRVLIIGSVALQMWGLDPTRKVSDLDIISSYDDCVAYIKEHRRVNGIEGYSLYPIDGGKKLLSRCRDGTTIEAEIAWGGSNQEQLLDLIWDSTFSLEVECFPGVRYAAPSVLYALKMSHRYLKDSPHFLKTMRDIHLLRGDDCTIHGDLAEWFKRREKETYTYSHPKLNVDKASFFQSGGMLQYVYDHDSIHEAVKVGIRPAYQYFSIDGEEVASSKEKFFAQLTITRLRAVLEESYVLALERSQIPHNFTIDRDKSFLMALEKVCTSITSGWFREFAWENYNQVKSMYSDEYVDKFRAGLSAGIIKPFKGQNEF